MPGSFALPVHMSFSSHLDIMLDQYHEMNESMHSLVHNPQCYPCWKVWGKVWEQFIHLIWSLCFANHDTEFLKLVPVSVEIENF